MLSSSNSRVSQAIEAQDSIGDSTILGYKKLCVLNATDNCHVQTGSFSLGHVVAVTDSVSDVSQ